MFKDYHQVLWNTLGATEITSFTYMASAQLTHDVNSNINVSQIHKGILLIE